MTRSLPLLWAIACGGGGPPGADSCEPLCQELVTTCALAAFPSYDSCLDGCLFDAQLGADVAGELSCVEGAGCDTFAIVECEHDYGVD
ncbi:MAG: hypothetical protein ABMB14_05745 [Myxococcota bacterium]